MKERVEKIISMNKIIICKEFNKHENIEINIIAKFLYCLFLEFNAWIFNSLKSFW